MLRNRSLAALLVAELVSMTGTQLTFIALPWLVLVTTGSVVKMSIVLAAEVVPMAIFGIPSGSVVARLGGRRTMLACDLVRAPLMAVVPVLHWAGELSFGVLVALVFVLGLLFTPYFAAQRTIVPELFGDDERLVSQAGALLGGANSITLVIGPAVGGILVSWLGAPAVLLLDAVSYLVAFALVFVFVGAGARVPQDEGSRGIFAGVRFLARDRVLGPLTAVVILLDACAAALFTTFPALAFIRYDQDAHVAGWLFAAFGLGAVGGSLLAIRALDRFHPLRLAAGAILLAVVPLWALVFTLPWEGVALVLFVAGLFVPLINAPAMGLITTRPPAALRAKVMTVVLTASALGSPGGRLVIGPLFDDVGISWTYALIACSITLAAVLFAAVALRGAGSGPAEQEVDALPAGDLATV
jgi:predicted MFS family arabinose efflux permease